MHAAIVTLDGFNELDSLIAYSLLSRAMQPTWRVSIAAPTPFVRSKNGLVLEAQCGLADVNDADVVVIGSGIAKKNKSKILR
jgi:putative intracellular protease/amidase